MISPLMTYPIYPLLPPMPHVHEWDYNYPSEWKPQKRLSMHGTQIQYLVAERVCSECKAKYMHEVMIDGSVLNYILSKPKAAKELGF